MDLEVIWTDQLWSEHNLEISSDLNLILTNRFWSGYDWTDRLWYVHDSWTLSVLIKKYWFWSRRTWSEYTWFRSGHDLNISFCLDMIETCLLILTYSRRTYRFWFGHDPERIHYDLYITWTYRFSSWQISYVNLNILLVLLLYLKN